MARMPLLAAAAGGRRRLVDLWATAPSGARNWQEPLGQDNNIFAPWSSWSRGTKIGLLFWACAVALFFICWGVLCLIRRFCRGDKDDELDTSRFVPGPWSNNDDDGGEGVSAPLPPLQEHQPPENGDGGAPPSNSGEGDGDRPPRRRRRQRQPPAVAVVPAGDVEVELAQAGDWAQGGVHLTPAGVEWAWPWALANNLNLGWVPPPPADVEMGPPADEEIATEPEPGPTIKFTFSTAEGWTEATCSVCLSEMVDGQKVRVLTACMHYFHATCIETWLHRNPTCPVCRAPAMAVPARAGRRRRRMTEASA